MHLDIGCPESALGGGEAAVESIHGAIRSGPGWVMEVCSQGSCSVWNLD